MNGNATRALILGLAMAAAGARAGEVEIRHARLEASGPDAYRVSVTLRHGDTGWDHYADEWRLVTPEGEVLGRRVLHHPHVEEQPFTRSLGRVTLPPDASVIFVEAHDKVHGWSDDRLRVDLRERSGERYEIDR